jgi:hypothetical protein
MTAIKIFFTIITWHWVNYHTNSTTILFLAHDFDCRLLGLLHLEIGPTVDVTN